MSISTRTVRADPANALALRWLTTAVPAGDNEVEFFEFADAFGRKVDQGWEPG